jgi:hypothetical protein
LGGNGGSHSEPQKQKVYFFHHTLTNLKNLQRYINFEYAGEGFFTVIFKNFKQRPLSKKDYFCRRN